jgi:hypothetical protein
VPNLSISISSTSTTSTGPPDPSTFIISNTDPRLPKRPPSAPRFSQVGR